jgi:protein-tyrosine phosphatase
MKILMVCLGNICRSPMAEGILRFKINERGLPVEVDSAGTGDYHIGESPDERAVETANLHGVDISTLAARQFTSNDFDVFDRIFVMDGNNRREVLKHARNEDDHGKVQLMLDLLYPGEEMEVPDPWFGNMEGFTRVFEMLDSACEQLVTELSDQSVGRS